MTAVIQDFVIGPLRLTVEYRRGEDEGPTVRVYGREHAREIQMLRFDCFAEDPHYHYDPDGIDELHHMGDEGIEDSTEWTLQCLERNLVEMIRRAGYSSLAEQVDAAEIARHLPSIRDAMMNPVV